MVTQTTQSVRVARDSEHERREADGETMAVNEKNVSDSLLADDDRPKRNAPCFVAKRP